MKLKSKLFQLKSVPAAACILRTCWTIPNDFEILTDREIARVIKSVRVLIMCAKIILEEDETDEWAELFKMYQEYIDKGVTLLKRSVFCEEHVSELELA